MYVEDTSDRIIREAKIKAHGKCNKHKNHFNWEDFWIGVWMSGVSAFIIGGVTIDQVDKNNAKEVAELQQSIFSLNSLYATQQSIVKPLSYVCTFKNGTTSTGTSPGGAVTIQMPMPGLLKCEIKE